MYLKSFDDNTLDYLPPEIVRRYRDKNLNPADSIDIALNKRKFLEVMQENNISCIPYIFAIHRDGTIETNSGEKVRFPDMIMALRETGHTEFFVKPCTGLGGRAIVTAALDTQGLVVSGKRIDNISIFSSCLFVDDDDEEFILQAKFEQHELLHCINSSSVNTVRIDTLVQGEEIRNNAAVLRMSNGKHAVDNWRYGGIIVPLDLQSGRLGAVGVFEAEHGGGRVREHPLTKFRFEDTVLPYWAEVLDLVRSAAAVLLPLKYLGWDVAIGREGPVILETNHDLDILMMQVGASGLRHTAIGQAVIQAQSLPRDI